MFFVLKICAKFRVATLPEVLEFDNLGKQKSGKTWNFEQKTWNF